MDFNITENEQFIDITPRPTLQLAFEKLPSSFVKEEEPQFLVKTIRIVTFFPSYIPVWAKFSSYEPDQSQHVS